MFQPPGRGVGLLRQLPQRGLGMILTFDVDQARWQLPQIGPQRVPVLADQSHPVLIVERHHTDRVKLVHDVALDDLAVRHGHPFGEDPKERPTEPFGAFHYFIQVRLPRTRLVAGPLERRRWTPRPDPKTADAAGSAGSLARDEPVWPRNMGELPCPSRRIRRV